MVISHETPWRDQMARTSPSINRRFNAVPNRGRRNEFAAGRQGLVDRETHAHAVARGLPPILSTLAGATLSSVPGLYFVGVAAANSFGPLLRFACGADYTARRLAPHLAAA
jgi:hypothetical protein